VSPQCGDSSAQLQGILCVAASGNGDTWSEFTVNPNNGYTSQGDWLGFGFGQHVAYGGGVFAALGLKNIFTSADGIAWTARRFFGATNFHGPTSNFVSQTSGATIVWANNQFIATHPRYDEASADYYPDYDELETSSNGITWSPVVSTLVSTVSMAYGAGRIVAATGNGIFHSTTGSTWTAATWTSTPTTTFVWQSVTWGGPAGNEKFVAVRKGVANNARDVATSANGITWTLGTSEPLANALAANPSALTQWGGVTWGGAAGQQKFVAVGQAAGLSVMW
jgi:hypothetical protein